MNQIILDNTKLIPVLVKIISEYFGFQGILENKYKIDHKNEEYKSAYYRKFNKINYKYPGKLENIIEHNNKLLFVYEDYLISYYPNFTIHEILFNSYEIKQVIPVSPRYLIISHVGPWSFETIIFNLYQNRIKKKYDLKYLCKKNSNIYLYDRKYVYKVFLDQKVHELKQIPKIIKEICNAEAISNNQLMVCIGGTSFGILDTKQTKFDFLKSAGSEVLQMFSTGRYLLLRISNKIYLYPSKDHKYIPIIHKEDDYYSKHKRSVGLIRVDDNSILLFINEQYIQFWSLPDLVLLKRYKLKKQSNISFVNNRLLMYNNNMIKEYL